jgi:hypothetical protein
MYSLTGGTDNGDFSQSVYVNGYGPTNATGGPIANLEEIPAYAYPTVDGIKFTSPPRSVQYIVIEPGEHVSSTGNHQDNRIADGFTLDQNYPNPFNPSTTISYSLPQASTVTLTVYDPEGCLITTLIDNEKKEAGSHTRTFNAANLPSGVYFYRLQAGSYMETKKMALIK